MEHHDQHGPYGHANKGNSAALHEGGASNRTADDEEDKTDCKLQNQSESGDTGGLLVGVLVSSHRRGILRGNGGIPGARVGTSGYCIPVLTAPFWTEQTTR